MNIIQKMIEAASRKDMEACRRLFWEAQAQEIAYSQEQNQDGEYLPLGSLLAKAEQAEQATQIMREICQAG